MSAPTDGHGVYENINPDTGASTWQPRLDQIAAGGFSLVLNYALTYGTTANMLAYINYAASKGLKAIIALNDSGIWESNNIPFFHTEMYASAGSPVEYTDGFFIDSSAYYTQGHNDGGSNGVWTWDTANTRVVASGGAEAVLQYTNATFTDGYVEVVMDQSHGGGLTVRRTDGNNCYTLYVHDSSDSSYYQIDKIIAGSYAQIGTGSITWTRGDKHRFRFQAVGTTISFYMDGTLIQSMTDTALSSGKVGLIGDNTSACNFYSLALSAMPDFVTYVINQTKNLPGTWGYYLADEVVPGEEWLFSLHADNIKIATTLPRLIILTSTTTNNSFSATTPYYKYCEVGGDDTYPLDGFARIPVAETAYNIQQFCTSKSIGSAIVLQAHSLNQYYPLAGSAAPPPYHFPTAASMAAWRQAAETLMNTRMVLWYSYNDAISVDVQHWNNLISALTLDPDIITPFNSAILATTPIRYYPMDDVADNWTAGLAMHDMSRYRETASYYFPVMVGQPTLLGDRTGTSVQFSDPPNALPGTISIPNNGMPTGAQPFSVGIGFILTAAPGNADFWGLVAFGDPATTNHEFTLYANNGVLHAGFNAGADIVSGTLALNTPYYAVATYDGTTLRLYLNGVLQASTATTPNISYGVDFATVGSVVGYSERFPSGRCQAAGFWNYALVPTWVTTLANAFKQISASIQTNATLYVRGGITPTGAPITSPVVDDYSPIYAGDIGNVFAPQILHHPSMTPLNLTGATISMKMQNSYGTVKTCDPTKWIIDDAVNGRMHYFWQNADINTAGLWTLFTTITIGGLPIHADEKVVNILAAP